MKPNCDCIKRLNEAVDREFGEHSEIMWEQMGNMSGDMWLEPPRVKIRFHRLLPNGKPERKVRRSWIEPRFCQFCGKAYLGAEQDSKVYAVA